LTGGTMSCGMPSACGVAPMMGTGDCHLGVDSSCVCHSDADCPADFPYCYPSSCGILCHATPSPADAGLQYVACTPANPTPANYGIACGGTTCVSEAEQCCVVAGSSTCQSRSVACSAADAGSAPPLIVQCDGPEDCPFGAKCCEYGAHRFDTPPNLSNVVFCGGDCPPPDPLYGGGTACHTSADCPAAFPTCAASDGGPLSFCQ
jgi:hypothetical protein